MDKFAFFFIKKTHFYSNENLLSSSNRIHALQLKCTSMILENKNLFSIF